MTRGTLAAALIRPAARLEADRTDTHAATSDSTTVTTAVTTATSSVSTSEVEKPDELNSAR